MQRMDATWIKPLIKIGLVVLFMALCFGWYWVKFYRIGRHIAQAIEKGDVAALRILLQKNRSYLVDDDYELLVSYLMVAMMENSTDCMKELLSLGGNAAHLQERLKETDDVELLNLCVQHGSPEMLRLLLESGMKPETETESPWLSCIVHGSVEKARVLVELGADKITESQSQEAHGNSPLHAVVYGWFYNPEESLAMLRYLLHEYGADVNACSISGNTPLDLACDETHVGYEKNDELRRLLTEAGGKRGRNLRVPVPTYSGRVFVKGELPDVATIAKAWPEGVTITAHTGQWNADTLRESLDESPLKDEVIAQIMSHTAYVEVAVLGNVNDDPVSVAERALTALFLFETMPGVVGVQFQSFIGSAFKGEPGELMPYNLVGVALGRTEDDEYLLATQGMTDYGLPEVELEMPESVYEKRLTPFEPLADVLYQLMRGTSAIEPGHTMTLCNLYSEVEWGTLVTTGCEGYRVVMYDEATAEHLLKPEKS
ncbi:MAG: ankyrin repeat domain-containing protein [Akkermansia sp.]|nr:ankyrin repeat domain-containing protein [Akkermansia sp.]